MAGPAWCRGLDARTPAHDASRRVLRGALRSVAKRMRKVSGAERADAEKVHAMRVATRRTESAAGLFEPFVTPALLEKARKRLKHVRQAGGAARSADVHLAEIRRWMRAASDEDLPALKYLVSRASRERREAQAAIAKVQTRYPPTRWKRLGRRLIREIGHAAPRETLLDLVARSISARAGEFSAAAGGDLHDLAQVHALRLAVKRLRYDLELASQCLSGRIPGELTRRVERLQDGLGRLNDRRDAADRLGELLAQFDALPSEGDHRNAHKHGRRPSPPVMDGLRRVAEQARRRRDRAHERFLASWHQTGARTLAQDLDRAVTALREAPPGRGPLEPSLSAPAALVQEAVEPPARENGRPMAHRPSPPAAPAGDGFRLAAIDVGTNSIRLIVAEAQPDGSYRVLDDEKEIARLGRGLDSTGRLDPAAMEHSATTISRMRQIALGYGVAPGDIRVVGTCAVREAANREEFIALVRQRAGTGLEVVSAEEEAGLAFRSASNAVELGAAPAAVMDIGGGSTEIVLSVAGAVERIYTIPLGAVRLTERFGGPVQCAGPRYKEMRAAIKRTFKQHIGRPPSDPRILVGTGGTVTTLASMVIHAELGPAADGLFAGSVQGRQVRRWEVRHLLNLLREMPLRDRARISGLSPDRADIIVAGLALVDCAMRRLRVDSLTAHEGGIRDGLLLSMVRERQSPGPDAQADRQGTVPARDPMRSIRRFARGCGYEHRHCTHVAALALQIFDSLAADPRTADHGGFSPENRAVLEAAALIHDVGYVVNYTGHHRHSYHLILHGDLPGWSARQIEIIANLARYHRRAEPKESHGNFARLSREDQRRVRALAAILRIADGLDRTHMQRITAARTSVERSGVCFRVESAEEPTVDIWGATRKAGLFKDVFGLDPRFEWAPVTDAAQTPVVVLRHAAAPA